MADPDMACAAAAPAAAASGTADALFELGLQCCAGGAGRQDLISAHKWFNLAASRGSVAARDYRQDVARELDAADIAEAQRQARAWLATKH